MAAIKRVIKGKPENGRDFVHVIVGENGQGADKLLELLEEGTGRQIFSMCPVGASIHYILIAIPFVNGQIRDNINSQIPKPGDKRR